MRVFINLSANFQNFAFLLEYWIRRTTFLGDIHTVTISHLHSGYRPFCAGCLAAVQTYQFCFGYAQTAQNADATFEFCPHDCNEGLLPIILLWWHLPISFTSKHGVFSRFYPILMALNQKVLWDIKKSFGDINLDVNINEFHLITIKFHNCNHTNCGNTNEVWFEFDL